MIRRFIGRKKILSIASIVLLVSIVVAGGTLAYFVSETKALNNVIGTGGVNVGVVLGDAETTYYEDEYSLGTGGITALSVEDITNGVRIKNIDSEGAYPTIKTYVRVRLVAIWRDA